MKTVLLMGYMFLAGFLTEYPLLGLKKWWKLLAAAPIAALFVFLRLVLPPAGENGCGMGQLMMLLLMAAPASAGIVLAWLVRGLRWLLSPSDEE